MEIIAPSEHLAPHRFQTGNNAAVGHGRPRGAKPKLAAMFWDDLYAVWKDKGMGILERMAEDDPVNFAKIAAMLVGKVEEAHRPDDMRDTVIEAFIEERHQKAIAMIEKMDEPDFQSAQPPGQGGGKDTD